MTIFNWTYSNCMCLTEGGLTDIVKHVQYTCTGTDTGTESSMSGTVTLTDPDSENFVDFSSLTFEIIDAWVKDALGPNGLISIEACIQGQINSIKNPPVAPEFRQLPF